MPDREGLELVQADLLHEHEVRDAVTQAAFGPGGLRAVVNLVGGYAAGAPLHETPLEDFEKLFRLNLRPTFLVTRAAVPYMLDAGGGSIVCVSARAAVQPFGGAVGYVSSKAAVLAFAQAVAADYRDRRRALQRSSPERGRHAGEPRGAARRRPLALGGADRDRGRDPVPVLGRVGAGQRRGRAGVRAGLADHAYVDDFGAQALGRSEGDPAPRMARP